jgi:hypothetical protein
MSAKSPRTEAQIRQQRRRIARGLAADGELLKGCLIERFTVCGRAGCRCLKGKKHGPYLYVSVFDGRQSRQFYVPQSMQAEVRRWVHNAQQLAETVVTLTQLAVELIRRHPEARLGASRIRRQRPEAR